MSAMRFSLLTWKREKKKKECMVLGRGGGGENEKKTARSRNCFRERKKKKKMKVGVSSSVAKIWTKKKEADEKEEEGTTKPSRVMRGERRGKIRHFCGGGYAPHQKGEKKGGRREYKTVFVRVAPPPIHEEKNGRGNIERALAPSQGGGKEKQPDERRKSSSNAWSPQREKKHKVASCSSGGEKEGTR